VRGRLHRLIRSDARRLVLPLAVLTFISTVGTAAAPTLAHDQPLVLVALSPRLAFLTLAAGKVGFVPFLVVGMLRLCLADPFHFALGRRHGAAAVDRVANRIRIPGISWLRRAAERCVPVLVFLRPNGTNLAIAGASRSRRLHVALADVAGTAAYLVAIHTFGGALL
jgi:hypothetical protein